MTGCTNRREDGVPPVVTGNWTADGEEKKKQEKISRLGSWLLGEGVISKEDLQKALSYMESLGGSIGTVLLRLGALSEENLLQALSTFHNVEILDPALLPEEPDVYRGIIMESGLEPDWWLDQEVIAWVTANGTLCYIARDPFADSLTEILNKTFTSHKIKPLLCRSYDLEKTLQFISNAHIHTKPGNDIALLKELAEEAPVIEFVSNLLSQAFDERASDVHVEPGEHFMQVRFRIDGILYQRFELPIDRFPAIASRIKIISNIDIAERRLPQDGRVSLRMSGVDVDLRVSTAPGVHGESIVLRLLPKEDRGFHLQSLGMATDHLALLQKWIATPYGIILVTGPTGSGKSTTLYSALEAINDHRKKIITVEDPVEFYLEGITQIQAHADIGYTFARALRSIMRQDPDVVMIGEIRDKETADIAVQASLTGHLVVSTLHTNNSISAFTRLIDIGVDPFLVATPVIAVMAQRLVRKLCPHCAVSVEVMDEVFQGIASFVAEEKNEYGTPNWKTAKGCEQCRQTGYQGRVGIYELVPVTVELQRLVLNNGSEHEMLELVRQQGVRLLREDGFLKAYQGITSVEEVLRVTSA